MTIGHKKGVELKTPSSIEANCRKLSMNWNVGIDKDTIPKVKKKVSQVGRKNKKGIDKEWTSSN